MHFPLFSEKQPEVKSLPKRTDNDPAHQWRLEDIFKTDEDWEREFEAVTAALPGLAAFQGTLGESARKMTDCFREVNRLSEKLYRLYLYAGLKNDQDTGVSKYQGFRDRATALAVQMGQAMAYMDPEILAIPARDLENLLADPLLQAFRHQLENLMRSKAHVLDAEQEGLLAMSGEMAQGPYNIFSMFNNADITFPAIKDENGATIEVTKGRINRLLESPSREVRQAAFEAMYGSYAGWTNTLAATLTANLKSKIFYARARKYPSALAAALHADHVPVAVYDNLVATLNNNLDPLHRFLEYRRGALNLEKLKPWDLYCPVVPEVNFNMSYKEGSELIREAMSPLGEDYQAILKEAFNNGWIDVYENQGKRAGAYSWSTFGVHPFILMNYNETLGDVFTLAHELGHALHSHYTHRHQPYHYSNYTIFVAEVASTLNEALLMDHLLKVTTEPRRRLYLLNEYADKIRGTVYIQSLFAELEKTIYARSEAGEPLTAESLSALGAELYQRYFGDAFQMDGRYEINWCRIPHFYYNFYVYKYVTGFSAATALARRILAGDREARDAYLHFLTRGNSAYSIDLLKDAGVDMSSPAPIEATTHLLNDLVAEMEKLG
ncbi:MAG TPA: oligoendopeptidase F [Calditrichia bacterium]|nr:oligoendopeptidase F [Calditrichota bacterium]HQU73223.1 oligoendopeptidase F [Calditrichia bacterium]HQV31868.1 oligoendopeptidase F [Calditrichia bacterium]